VQALQATGAYESSHVLFWGDHGYKLGEYCDWFKHDNYEASTRMPVLLKPASAGPHGWSSLKRGEAIEAIVEEVDIFPTLLELAGVPRQVSAWDGLQGTSWLPLLRSTPARGMPGVSAPRSEQPLVRAAAYSQYARYYFARGTQAMGYSMRTAEWRFTVWLPFACDALDPMANCTAASDVSPRWDQLLATELYDHRGDPSTSVTDTENENLAERPE
jgi:iduronate 2-sulfatase